MAKLVWTEEALRWLEDIFEYIAQLGVNASFLRRLSVPAMPPWYPAMRTELVTTLKRQAAELLSDLERIESPS